MSAFGVDRKDGFEPDLKIAADPDHARIDRSGRESAVAVVVRDRRCELYFDDRNQVIDEVGQLVVADFPTATPKTRGSIVRHGARLKRGVKRIPLTYVRPA